MDEIRDPGGPAPRRRVPPWLPLPLGIAIGLLGGLGYGLTATPMYSATSYVMVVPKQAGDSATALGFAQAYGRVATASAVLAGAQGSARTSAAVLKGHVRTETSPDAPMIAVTGTATRGTTAARIANAVARSLTATGDRDAASTGVRLLVFAPADPPASPASPSAALSGAVGASAGGLLGALALLVRPKERRYEREAAAVPAPVRSEPARAAV
ncbi:MULTISPECIES: lipopolysaccharide biosynthesis protein [unclassified Streptomyces]|uniref:lipopolysaccharide biosynthesis protein n=1 Tax=unclassified Streptomyces TaxID=2593676 RepID=UPI002E2DE088|nr:lipopolysaccharide biosynthesis protein [Streptomyces sp. NBC_00223]